jgi:anti-sigma factor (TIGR02949 family)
MSDETMVPCDHVIAKLWEYLDGGLDQLRSDEVHRHLDICARCFPEFDFRRAYLNFMRRCRTEGVPPELRRQICAMVLDEGATDTAAAETTGFAGRARKFLRRLLDSA